MDTNIHKSSRKPVISRIKLGDHENFPSINFENKKNKKKSWR